MLMIRVMLLTGIRSNVALVMTCSLFADNDGVSIRSAVTIKENSGLRLMSVG